MLDAAGFEEWLKKGPERAPLLYGAGKIDWTAYRAEKTVSAQARPIPVRQDVAVDGPTDFKSAAAGDDWDGIEPEEEPK